MVSACILIANGTEEMEFTIIYDTLVRAGVKCTSVAVYTAQEGNKQRGDRAAKLIVQEGCMVQCSRGLRVLADEGLAGGMAEDALLESMKERYDAIIIPGGAKGAETISKDPRAQGLIKAFWDSGKVVGMICAGSMAALTTGLHKTYHGGKIKLTSHPSVKEQLTEAFDYSEDPVVVHNKLITSRGPGTAFPFALQLVEILCDLEKRKEITAPMVFPPASYSYN